MGEEQRKGKVGGKGEGRKKAEGGEEKRRRGRKWGRMEELGSEGGGGGEV